MSAATIKWFGNLERLPSLPGQIMAMLEEMTRDSTKDNNFIQMIQNDPAITLQILKTANTSLYGYPAKIASLQQAVGLVGLSVVKNIILTTPVLERFREDGIVDHETDYSKLWLHLSISGALAGCLGGLIPGMERDVCFTAGLIHDVGKIALAVHFPETLANIKNLAKRNNCSLLQAERETIGFSHSEVAMEFMQAWALPDQMIQAVGMCCYPDTKDIANKMTAVIFLAKHTAFQWGFPDGLEIKEPERLDPVMATLKITETDLRDWEPQLREYVNLTVSDFEN